MKKRDAGEIGDIDFKSVIFVHFDANKGPERRGRRDGGRDECDEHQAGYGPMGINPSGMDPSYVGPSEGWGGWEGMQLAMGSQHEMNECLSLSVLVTLPAGEGKGGGGRSNERGAAVPRNRVFPSDIDKERGAH